MRYTSWVKNRTTHGEMILLHVYEGVTVLGDFGVLEIGLEAIWLQYMYGKHWSGPHVTSTSGSVLLLPDGATRSIGTFTEK